MTDRELLELAAKAAGFKRWNFKPWPDYMNVYYGNDDIDEEWNPLYDDADALRLAVKLGLNIEFSFGMVAVSAGPKKQCCEDLLTGDTAAARRAIVRAAAEIGKAD